MGKLQLAEDFNVFAAPAPDGRGGPFTDAVDRDDGRFFEWRWIKGAGRVRQMVLRVVHRNFGGAEFRKVLTQHAAHE